MTHLKVTCGLLWKDWLWPHSVWEVWGSPDAPQKHTAHHWGSSSLYWSPCKRTRQWKVKVLLFEFECPLYWQVSVMLKTKTNNPSYFSIVIMKWQPTHSGVTEEDSFRVTKLKNKLVNWFDQWYVQWYNYWEEVYLISRFTWHLRKVSPLVWLKPDF